MELFQYRVSKYSIKWNYFNTELVLFHQQGISRVCKLNCVTAPFINKEQHDGQIER